MFGVIRNFFSRGFEDINIFLVQPFLRMSFYKKCFFIILAGVALYIPYINVFNATHDEKYTLLMCQFDVVEMIRRMAIEDGHPPFHYLFAKFWIAFISFSEVFDKFFCRFLCCFI